MALADFTTDCRGTGHSARVSQSMATTSTGSRAGRARAAATCSSADADGTIADVTPRDINVRTRVHEYGGGAYVVAGGVVYFSNFADQRVYRIARESSNPAPITPAGQWFYADALRSQRSG